MNKRLRTQYTKWNLKKNQTWFCLYESDEGIMLQFTHLAATSPWRRESSPEITKSSVNSKYEAQDYKSL